jgi:hypothetical protein
MSGVEKKLIKNICLMTHGVLRWIFLGGCFTKPFMLLRKWNFVIWCHEHSIAHNG